LRGYWRLGCAMANGLKIERGYFGLGSPNEAIVKAQRDLKTVGLSCEMTMEIEPSGASHTSVI
jgi:hypothetical protein